MEITTAAAWNWDNNLYSLCIEGDEANMALHRAETNPVVYECDLSAGAQLLFSCAGVFDESPEYTLDDKWAKFSTEMVFDEHPLNLTAFGPLEFTGVTGRDKYRIWNVLLKNLASGEHVLYCRSELDDEVMEGTYHFTVSEAP